jgi:hypothetical protein
MLLKEAFYPTTVALNIFNRTLNEYITANPFKPVSSKDFICIPIGTLPLQVSAAGSYGWVRYNSDTGQFNDPWALPGSDNTFATMQGYSVALSTITILVDGGYLFIGISKTDTDNSWNSMKFFKICRLDLLGVDDLYCGLAIQKLATATGITITSTILNTPTTAPPIL